MKRWTGLIVPMVASRGRRTSLAAARSIRSARPVGDGGSAACRAGLCATRAIQLYDVLHPAYILKAQR